MPPQYKVLDTFAETTDAADVLNFTTKASSVSFPDDPAVGGELVPSQPSTIDDSREDTSRKVRFSDHLDIKQIPGISDLSQEEREACYLTNYDMQRMEESVRSDVIFAAMKYSDPDTRTSRGLEWKTFEGTVKRFNHYKKGLSAVLDEQRRQRDSLNEASSSSFALDADRIAACYHQAIGFCQVMAYTMGANDEAAAQPKLSNMIQTEG